MRTVTSRYSEVVTSLNAEDAGEFLHSDVLANRDLPARYEEQRLLVRRQMEQELELHVDVRRVCLGTQ